MSDDEEQESGPDSDGEGAPCVDVDARDASMEAAALEPAGPAAAAHAPVGEGSLEATAAWVPGWARPVPDIRPENKAVRNHGDKLTDGPSGHARSADLSSPLKCFLAVWTRGLIERIQRVTTAKLVAKGKPALDYAELLVFFALEVTMGLKRQGSVRSYYDKKHFALMNPHFAHVMQLHRFETISGSLRFVDALPAEGAPVPAGSDWYGKPRPTDPLYNRAFKVAPVLEAVMDASSQLWNLGKNVSLDEMCVKSKGRTATKKYNPKKPIKYHIRMYGAGSPKGVITRALVHHWDDRSAKLAAFKAAYPECTGVLGIVLKLLEGVESRRTIFLDNWYCTFKLFQELLARGFNAVGTVRANRGFPTDHLFPKIAATKGLPMGSCAHLRSLDGKVLLTGWFDNGMVCVASTVHEGITGSVQRLTDKLKENDPVAKRTLVFTNRRRKGTGGGYQVEVGPQPKAVSDYIANMGGVDLADQLRSYHTVHRKCKVWFRALYYWALDTALINAHLIYKELHPDRAAISTQAFRAEVVDALIATAGVTLPPTINVSPPSLRAVALPVVRGHKGDLAVVPLQHDLTVAGDANSRGDCALCGRKAMFKCTTCTGTHKKGLWFCISSERNCWGVVHKQ